MSTALALLAMASSAFAHTGAGAHFDFISGFTHPLSGLDHLLAMVGVGFWAALAGGTAKWAWPAAFVSVMVAGVMLALGGIAVPFGEAVILASVIGIGAVVALRLRAPVVIGAAACAVFALAHGHAHGNELPLAASVVSYVSGIVIATVALHMIGIGLGGALRRSSGLTRFTGGAIAAAGALLTFV